MASCRSDLAAEIKERLTARQVIEFYGFHPNRTGYIQCPFHTGDDHGSLKVYDGKKSGWHCFGCGAGSTVIDFVMKLFNINFRQACLRLDADFSLGLTGEKPSAAEVSAVLAARRQEAERKAAADREYRGKAAEHCYWWQVKKLLAPDAADATAGYIHPLYAEAIKRLCRGEGQDAAEQSALQRQLCSEASADLGSRKRSYSEGTQVDFCGR